AFSIGSLSFVASALVLVRLILSVAVKRQYMHSFRRALEKKTIEPEAVELRTIDAATMKTLLVLLSSDDERQVLYALDLLSNTHPGRWRDHINLLIHHRSSAVRARTIAVLASWSDASIAREEFIHHADYETARIATAGALRFNWNDLPRDTELLDSLIRDPSIEVSREAIMTAGIVGHEPAIPVLISKLADKNLRRYARGALLKYGDRVIPELINRLSDKSVTFAVRKRIPKTLAFTGKQQAAEALMRHYHRLDYHVD